MVDVLIRVLTSFGVGIILGVISVAIITKTFKVAYVSVVALVALTVILLSLAGVAFYLQYQNLFYN